MAFLDFAKTPFGIRKFQVKDFAVTPVTTVIPAAMKMSIKPTFQTADLYGDDVTVATVSAITDWTVTVEVGGLALDAYAALLGATLPTTSGVTPNQITPMTLTGAQLNPFLKLGAQMYGQLGDNFHIFFYYAKLTDIQGAWGNGQFLTTSLVFKCIPSLVTADLGKVFLMQKLESAAVMTMI